MLLKREEVFSLFRNSLGTEEASNITDRTINECIDGFANIDFGDEEKEKTFWQTQIEFLGKSVKGNISSIASRETKRVAEEASKKMADELSKKTPNMEIIESLKKEIEDAKAEAKAKDDVINKIKAWQEEQDKIKAENDLKAKIEKRRVEVTSLCHKAENGMTFEPILEPLLAFYDFSADKDVSVYVEEIKAKYNDMYSRQTKKGAIPLVGNGGGNIESSDDFCERIRKKRADEEKKKKEALERLKR